MLPLCEVVLGTDDDAGYRAHATKVDNLVVDYLDHVEGFPGGDGVYEDEAVDSNGVFGIQDRVFILCGEKGVSTGRASKGRGEGTVTL